MEDWIVYFLTQTSFILLFHYLTGLCLLVDTCTYSCQEGSSKEDGLSKGPVGLRHCDIFCCRHSSISGHHNTSDKLLQFVI